MVCSNKVAIWHRFRDITTYTVYVNGCDFEKYLVFEKIVEITSHVRFSIHV